MKPATGLAVRGALPLSLALALLVGAGLALAPARAGAGAEGRERRKAETLLAEFAVHFEKLQSDPVRAVPAAILREARGLLIVRETRAGLLLGGKSGSGVVLLQRDGAWGPPGVYRLREGGIGLQAGWQRATFAHVLMTEAAVEALRTNRFRMGVGLRVTSGPRSVGDEAKTHSPGADVLIYSDTGGLFGGVAMEGGVFSPDDAAHQALYGDPAPAPFADPPPAPTPGGRRLMELIAGATRDGEGTGPGR